MSAAIQTLTAVIFAAHMLIGCCAHHADALHDACVGHDPVADVADSHQPADTPHEHEHDDSHHNFCEGVACHALVSPPTADLLIAVDPLAVATIAPVTAAASTGAAHCEPPPTALPLRASAAPTVLLL